MKPILILLALLLLSGCGTASILIDKSRVKAYEEAPVEAHPKFGFQQRTGNVYLCVKMKGAKLPEREYSFFIHRSALEAAYMQPQTVKSIGGGSLVSHQDGCDSAPGEYPIKLSSMTYDHVGQRLSFEVPDQYPSAYVLEGVRIHSKTKGCTICLAATPVTVVVDIIAAPFLFAWMMIAMSQIEWSP
jgi:hypothetical protein